MHSESSMDHRSSHRHDEETDSTNDASQHQGLAVRVGEDAYFVRKDGMGVADGVGGWKDVVTNSNAALFSSLVMHHVASHLHSFDAIDADYSIHDYYSLDPVSLLQSATTLTLQDASLTKAVGSTTALIAFLRDDELRIASLGDTTLVVVRNGDMVFRTEEQQHSFNFPFQLGSESKDTPEKDAGDWVFKVKEGDLVILGSDGIFDNLFDSDILEIIRTTTMGPTTTSPTIHQIPTSRILRTPPHLLASNILSKAREISLDSGPYVVSPFQERAVKEGLYYQGGKVDDLTVVVGIVKVVEDSPDRR
ncbi:hypothetical protein HDU98_006268 [Podochytrium sp. JEL0797]|nr:hypothetical protein HDU98_006268 [Podochytrium sp. JEL0797]